MIIIKKILILLCLFFLFNTLEVDSNSDKILFYDIDNLYDEDDYYIYFDDMNSNILNNIIYKYNIRILSYNIDNNKYYANNIDELYNIYTKDKSIEEIIYYEKYGIKIDSIHVISDVDNLIKLSKEVHIY